MAEDLLKQKKDELAALRRLITRLERDAELLGKAGLNYLREKLDELIARL